MVSTVEIPPFPAGLAPRDEITFRGFEHAPIPAGLLNLTNPRACMVDRLPAVKAVPVVPLGVVAGRVGLCGIPTSFSNYGTRSLILSAAIFGLQTPGRSVMTLAPLGDLVSLTSLYVCRSAAPRIASP